MSETTPMCRSDRKHPGTAATKEQGALLDDDNVDLTDA